MLEALEEKKKKKNENILLIYYEIQKIIVPLYRVRERSKKQKTTKKNHDEKANFSIQKDDQSRFDPLGANGLHRSFVQPVKVLTR